MTAKAHVLGLLPARGGSKGIPGKNLRILRGKPLIAWASTALANAEGIARKICCTDDPAIAEAARKYGLETPWLRPFELAQDETLVVDVVAHALETLSMNNGVSFTHVALVQATSPSVTSSDIKNAVELAVENDADTVITGFHAGQRHPDTMYTHDSHGRVHWLLERSDHMARRQDLAPVFIRTGLVYVIKSKVLMSGRTIYGEHIMALTIPEERSITIDEEHDFQIAEILLNRKNHG